MEHSGIRKHGQAIKGYCEDINLLFYLLVILIVLAMFYVIFGWGESSRIKVNFAGRSPEVLLPPEVERVVPQAARGAAAGAGGAAAGALKPVPEIEGVILPAAPPKVKKVVFGFGESTKVGLKLIPIDLWHLQTLGLKNNEGALVYSVKAGSMASKAGIIENDVIIRVNGTAIDNANEFKAVEQTFIDGIRYRIKIIRKGKFKKLNLVYHKSALAVALQNTGPPWIGVNVQRIDSVIVKQFKLASAAGAIVASTAPKGPAAKANIVQGDIILEVDGKKIMGPTDLRVIFKTLKPGAMIPITIFRDGKMFTTDLTVETKPAGGPLKPSFLPAPSIEVEASWVGLTIATLTKKDAQRVRLGPNTHGVLVVAVANGPGLGAGLIGDDVIIGVNGHAVNDLREFKKAVQMQEGVVLDVLRDGGIHRYITIEQVRPHLLSNIKPNKAGSITRVAALMGATKQVAVGSYGNALFDQVYPYFDNSPFFIIYNPNDGTYKAIKNPAAGDLTKKQRFKLPTVLIKEGVGTIITGNMQRDIQSAFKAENFEVFTGAFGNTNNIITMYLGQKLIQSN
ncbi:MAG: PDZ domain-containing protein [Bacteriovoracaceae bacterium]|nr:PDZ domain-containing protein [Bacteriovoracaceae bacterium]